MSEETLDHNTALHNLIDVGDEQDVQMILGHKDKLRCGGIIRTGIKVLKKDATAAEVKLFKELEAQGLPYDEIDRRLGGQPKTNTSKLFPKNADHFVIRECDFKRPGDARTIIEKYADPDGKVRSFPIWLSVGDIDRVLWHSFKSFNGSGTITASSYYEGKQLMVRYLPKDFKGVPKQSDWLTAPLDADKPTSPAGHKLQFGGLLRFNIPGLRGFDEIFIPTKSYYGIGYSIALLRRIRARLGRFDGTLNGEPFLCISKSPEVVSDPKGNKVTQYIPVVELSVDPIELERYAAPNAVAARSASALAMLTGQSAAVAASPAAVEPEADASGTAVGDGGPVNEAVIALETLIAPHNLSLASLRIYGASQGQGVELEDLSRDEMKKFYRHVRDGLLEDPEYFVDMVREIAGEVV